jgi:peptidoglycan hydrolase-like protein with peptidoglycan-binding domain
MTTNALPLIAAAGAALLLLSRRGSSPAPDDGDGDGDVADEVERIVQESREIVQGKRDSYSDKPGEKVKPREAAERVKETLDKTSTNTGKVSSVADDEAALAAARAAVEQEALSTTNAKPKPKPKPKPAAPVIGVSISVSQAQQWLNYLGAKPKLAVDGKYGPKTKEAWAKAAKARSVATRFDRGTATTAMVDPLARDRLRNDAARAKSTKATPTPAPTPAPAPVPSGPTPPAGFDRTKASNSAPDVARNIATKKYSYSRDALKIWQKLAGVAQDGIYGKGSAAAMRYYVGPSAPKALFAQGTDHYPWGD